MQFRASLALVLGALATVLPGCATPRSAQFAATGVQPWYEIETAHFRVRTNADWPAALQTAGGLEKRRRALLLMWGEHFDPPGQLEVVVLRDSEQLSEFADAPVAAYMTLLPTGWQAVMAAKYPSESLAQVQLHELAHYLSRYILLRQPRWLSEGLATYLQTIEVKDNSVEAVIGRPPVPLLQYIRQHDVLSLADLWNGSAPSESRPELYASSWLWVHFLLNQQGARFNDFLNRLASAEEPRSAWNAAFTGVSSHALERGVRGYKYRERFPVRSLPVPPVAPQLTYTVLDEAEIHVTRARLYLTGRKSISADQRRELVLSEVVQALIHNPKNTNARVLEGELATSRSNRLAIAKELMRSKPQEPRVRSFFARSLQGEDEAFPDLEQTLETGAKVAADDHWVLSQLAAYYAAQGLPDRGLEAATRAVQLAPWNARILETYAAILAGVGDCGEAVAAQKRAMLLLDEHAPDDVKQGYEHRLGNYEQHCTASFR
jgi:tetratricopeptide (TPR) repeat protein